MDFIDERTEYVLGRSVQAGDSGRPAPPTAVGVYPGIRASLTHAFGSDDLEGVNVNCECTECFQIDRIVT